MLSPIAGSGSARQMRDEETMETLNARPRKILLATDLSGRCDRALDRAALLALGWKAGLVVVHALESDYLTAIGADIETPSWRRDANRRATIAERQIAEDLLDHAVPFEAVIEEGDPTDIILKSARDRGCDLIVTGTARSETFGRFILGATVDKVVRQASVPVLVVKSRARRPYGKLVVATDFSDSSRRALESAVELFPRSAITILHSFGPVGAYVPGKAWLEAGRKAAADACSKFLAESAIPPDIRSRLEVLLESGNVSSLLKAYAYDKGVDLLVVGSKGRSAVVDLLLGNTAATLLSSAPCDVLVVRENQAAAAPIEQP